MIRKKKAFPELNGLSIDNIKIDQDGDLTVVFDLPVEQVTHAFQRNLQGVRSLDIYEHPRIQKLCRDLFRAVREVALRPDPERARIDCENCLTSSCCRKYNVLVTTQDIGLLSRHLGMSPESFRRKYTSRAVDWCEDYTAQLTCDEDDNGEKCVFLKQEPSGQSRCTVYGARPQICRDFDMKTCTDFVALDDLGVMD